MKTLLMQVPFCPPSPCVNEIERPSSAIHVAMLRYCSRFRCLVEDAPCAVIMVKTFVSETAMQYSCRVASARVIYPLQRPRPSALHRHGPRHRFREKQAVGGVGVCRYGRGAEMYSNHPSF